MAGYPYQRYRNFKDVLRAPAFAFGAWRKGQVLTGSVTLSGPTLIESCVTGQITSAEVTATTAGNLGHANGVVLVPAPGAGYALVLDNCVISYPYVTAGATAGYGAGGNITVNWGAGGAAITGVVSAANSLGATAAKQVVFYPLTTAATALVANASLNLVAASAFTTASGAITPVNYAIRYQIVKL